MFVRAKKSGRYEYLQVVRSVRLGQQVRQEVIATLGRFGIGSLCIVGDRGMVSAETIRALGAEGRDVRFIMGMRLRKCKEVRDEVLSRAGRYQEVRGPRENSKDPAPLKVKEVWVGGHRYIVCLNEEEARKDARDREAIVASLRERLARGEKSLVGNRGYRRFLETTGTRRLAIDEAALQRFVVTTWDRQFLLRTAPQGDAGKAIQAVGVALGPVLRLCEEQGV